MFCRLGLLVALAIAGLIGPADAAPPVWLQAYGDQWRVARSKDPITDAPIVSVSAVTANVNNRLGFDLARLTLICTGGKAKLGLEWSFKAAGRASLAVSYRFQGRPGRSIGIRYVNRSEEQATAKSDIRQFLGDAAKSDSLLVRVGSDLGGIATATFLVRGGA